MAEKTTVLSWSAARRTMVCATVAITTIGLIGPSYGQPVNDPMAAWRSHNIPYQAAMAYIVAGIDPSVAAEWQSAGFSPDIAIPWIRRAYGPEDARELIASGETDPDAVAQKRDAARRQAEAAQAAYNALTPEQKTAKRYGQLVADTCHDLPEEESVILKFDDPYAIKDKCFAITIATRWGQKQWLDSNNVLIIDQFPNDSDTYETIIRDEGGHVRYGERAVVIGLDPTNYQTVSGAAQVAPTLRVVQYIK